MRFEIYIQPLLEAKFPNFLFWQEEFLDPMTDQVHGNWRSDTHEDLGKMAMASFGIIKSLVFIQHRKDKISTSAGDYDQSFKNIYQHFTLIFDCLEAMCHKIILLRNMVGLPPDLIQQIISEEELVQTFSKWAREKYPTKAEDAYQEGIPVFYYPHKNKSFLNLLITKSRCKEYNQFVKIIKDYRNFFAHNPGVDVFRKGDVLFALKKEHVKKAANWSDIRDHYANDPSLFTCPKEMINNDLDSLLKHLNEMWVILMEKTRELYDHEGFRSLFRGYKREYSHLNSGKDMRI